MWKDYRVVFVAKKESTGYLHRNTVDACETEVHVDADLPGVNSRAVISAAKMLDINPNNYAWSVTDLAVEREAKKSARGKQ